MRSTQRVEIKRVIDELNRQAVDLQKYRLSLIEEIRADPSYEQDILNAPLVSEGYGAPYQSDLAFYQPRHYHPNPSILDKIQRVLVVEASLLRIREKTTELDALIAPIQVLPDEVLGVMFELASRPEYEPRQAAYISWDSEHHPPLPIILASVCRRWRHVALGRSTLWKYICLTPWQPRAWAELALARSETHALDVIIDYCTSFSPKTEAVDDLLNLVIPRVESWKSLMVVAHHIDVLRHVSRRLLHLRAPNLYSLRLSLTGSGPPGNQVIALPQLFQGGAPMLSRVHLDSVGVQWLSHPFVGLRILDLRWLWNDAKLTYQQFRDLLAASPELSTLVLRGLYVELPSSLECVGVHIPKLSYLELSGDNVSRMLLLLNTPILEELSLANVDEAEFLDLVRSFDAPGHRQYPCLRSLHLLNVVTIHSMESFFDAMPNLNSLTIVHSAANKFLHLLSAQQSGGFFGPSSKIHLPRLQTLTLLDDASEERLLNIVLDRKAVGCPLQRVKVHAGSVNARYRALLSQHVKLDGVYYRDQSR